VSLEAVAQECALRFAKPTDQVKMGKVVDAAKQAAKDASANGLEVDRAVDTAVDEARKQATPAVSPSPLAILTKYIPTETITLYVAVQAAMGEIEPPAGQDISSGDFLARWIWVGVMLCVTFLLSLGFIYRAQLEPYKSVAKESRPADWFHWPWFELSATSAAFLVWALSLPQTPLQDFAWYDYNAWNSVLVLGGTVLIGAAAYVLNKTVAWTKVVNVSE